ncbi:MAG TPA: outer membrane protein transport protein [Polyangiaceae bacterium]|nr:outer membrane protein transport protein [Polyangiaceae bacterium]
MRHRVERALLAAVACIGVVPGNARASGFHIDEQDARATGRAGAVIASPKNASTIYYNPAGIGVLSGIHADAGASWVAPSTEFTSASDGSTTEAESNSFVLPQVYLTWRASDLVAVGVGFNAPFGLALEWPASSPGAAQVRNAELRTFFFTPAFALNLSRWVPGLCLGAGMDVVPASVQLARDIPFGSDVGSVTLGGDGFGVGGHGGILYQPPALPSLSLALTYRSPVGLDFSGDADFDAPDAYRASLPPDGPVETSVKLPQMVSLGIQYAPLQGLELEVDGTYRGWSSYDRLDIELPDGSVQSEPKDWEDSWTVRFGAEYTFAERYAVRIGAVWDQAPMPADRLEFQLPDANRFDVTLGFGAALTDSVRVDLGALYVFPQERSTSDEDPLEPPVKGQFRIEAWVVGLSVGVQFGAEADAGAEAEAREGD